MARPPYERKAEATNLLTRAVFNGDAYEISETFTLAADESVTIHIDPTQSGETVHISLPRITPSVAGQFEIFENATPTNPQNDLFVHNMRYDGQETPDTPVQRVANGNLDTSGADKTKETRVTVDSPSIAAGDGPVRGIYRTIPDTDIIPLRYTDRSNGSGNDVSMDLVMYEGETLPE